MKKQSLREGKLPKVPQAVCQREGTLTAKARLQAAAIPKPHCLRERATPGLVPALSSLRFRGRCRVQFHVHVHKAGNHDGLY